MKAFSWSTRVRSSEVGPDGSLRPVSALHLLQETGLLASESNGFGPARYSEMGMTFMVYRVDVALEHPARLADTLHLKSWVSDFKRVRSQRETVVTREDGAVVMRAQVMWIFMDSATHRPARMKDEFHDAFQPAPGVYAHPFPSLEPLDTGSTRESTRAVAASDVDGLGHVNHAVSLGYVVDDVTAHAADGWPRWVRLSAQYAGALKLGERASVRQLGERSVDGHLHSHHEVRGPEGLVMTASLVRAS